ncbi:MAG TPA: hypothetical protein DCZ63_15640 [Geobacter sp.]|nr:hypothetical protein [Geobacter sp.]
MWNYSTGLMLALNGLGAIKKLSLTAQTLAFQDGTGTGGRDRIYSSAGGLADFADYVHDYVGIEGSTSNDGCFKILAVAAGYIEVPAGSLSTEAEGDQVILSVHRGGSLQEVFRNSVLHLFAVSRPADADTTEGASPLVIISKNGGAFVSGSPTNGINFTVDADGNVVVTTDPATDADMVLKGLGLITGSALFGRLYANTVVTGNSTSAVRMDGRVGASGVEINMSAGTDITAGVYATVTNVNMSF